MIDLHFATSNKWKFNQAEKYFADKGINLIQYGIDLPESRAEEGLTIAREKARFAYKKLKQPLFVLDGSFHIKALNDFPKSYVKFVDKYIGAKGLLKLMKGLKDRRWEFLNILQFIDKNQEKQFIGYQKGIIIEKLNHNKKGAIRDFDRVLMPEGYKKTFAEMTKKEMAEYDEKIWKPGVFDRFITAFKKTPI